MQGPLAAAQPEAAQQAAAQSPKDVMISYTQKNDKAARLALDLYGTLERVGYQVWLDVKVDDKSQAAMEQAVKSSKFIIAILSDGQGEEGNAYFERPFCLKELRWAKEAKKYIQPVINVDDKSRIGELMNGGKYSDGSTFDGAPSDLGDLINVDMVDLNLTDSEYFRVGIQKIIRKAMKNGVTIVDKFSESQMSSS